MRKATNILVVILALLLAAPFTFAADLGINYYHETMMSDQWKVPYIPRTLSEVDQDLDHIATVFTHIKLYANPMVDGNVDWVEQVADRAKARGLYVVINMMTDDRDLDDSNWGDYTSRVRDACTQLSGHADEFLVGNEIVLHSPWNKYDVRPRVESLINDCKSRFSGIVSYEALWWEKEAWWDYPEPIHLMMYESYNDFVFNMAEREEKFGSRGILGEWGEDSIDGVIERDDWWQRLEIEKRWNVIAASSAPAGYIFTYREPSWNAFGIVRPDHLERPVWDYLRTITVVDQDDPVCTPSAEVCDGLDNDCDLQVDEGDVCAPPPDDPPEDPPADDGGSEVPPSESEGLGSFAFSCTATGGCSILNDAADAVCRYIQFSTTHGDVYVSLCDRDTEFHVYRNNYPFGVQFSACFDETCVSDLDGFEIISLEPVCEPSAEVCDGLDNDCDDQVDEGDVCAPPPQDPPADDFDLASLELSCSGDAALCTILDDVTASSCRTIDFVISQAVSQVKACDKGDGSVDIFTIASPGERFELCLANGCVSHNSGFANFVPDSSEPVDPPVDGGSDEYVLDTLPFTASPDGSLLSNVMDGFTCRRVAFSTSVGDIEAKACAKGAGFEMYHTGGTSQASICVDSYCVGQPTGFVAFP